jgi:hypothetical protein
MKARLKERRKALVVLAGAVVAEAILLVTGVEVSPEAVVGVLGVLLTLVVHEVPNASAV